MGLEKGFKGLRKMLRRKNKKGSLLESLLGKLIIGAVILVILVIGIMILTGKGTAALEYIKNLFKFGRAV